MTPETTAALARLDPVLARLEAAVDEGRRLRAALVAADRRVVAAERRQAEAVETLARREGRG
jgi:hypothetical protein